LSRWTRTGPGWPTAAGSSLRLGSAGFKDDGRRSTLTKDMRSHDTKAVIELPRTPYLTGGEITVGDLGLYPSLGISLPVFSAK